MDFVIVVVVLFAVVFVVTGPLRRPERSHAGGAGGERSVGAETSGGAEASVGGSRAGGGSARDAAGDQERESQLAELEALREAKYREIRDAELDHATGKLSQGDFEAVDGRLRAEALEILRELDRLAPAGDTGAPEDPGPAGGEAGVGGG